MDTYDFWLVFNKGELFFTSKKDMVFLWVTDGSIKVFLWLLKLLLLVSCVFSNKSADLARYFDLWEVDE